MLGRTDENELAVPLHQGAAEEGAMLLFLARLRRRAAADYVGLLHAAGESAPAPASELFVATGSLNVGWQQDYYRRNPALHQALRPDRVYGVGDLPDSTNGYVDGLLKAAAFEDQRVVRIVESGESWWLMIARHRGGFGAADGMLLSALAPHLHVAFRTTTFISRLRGQARLANDAAARLGLGWAVLDGRGRSLHVGGAGVPQDLPVPTKQAEAALRTHQRKDAWQTVVEPAPAHFEMSGADTVMYVRATSHDSEGAVPALVALFGLSVSEAKLAWAICRGASIAAAGERLRLTRETARNYTKRIYAKTGAAGQADLVRIILTGIAPFAARR